MSQSSRTPAPVPGAASRPRVRGRRALLGVTALAALAVVGVAVAQAGADGTPPSPSGGPLAPVAAGPGFEHVHGLGVDPADGVLYAATHFGLFRLPEDGEATLVANRYQDTMGFTVTGPRTFLGSGHPDVREGLPSRLGLVESRDAGQSWQPLSLQGSADFHALHAAHGLVYGYEAGSGAFLVSADRREWQTRSRLPLRDFQVSPDDADTVLATTEQGLLASADGGRSWEAVPGAPALVVLAWSAAGGLYGVGPDGSVHHSADAGATWVRRGSVGGPPEAVTVAPRDGEEALYVAVAERGVVMSTDGGRTSTLRHAG